MFRLKDKNYLQFSRLDIVLKLYLFVYENSYFKPSATGGGFVCKWKDCPRREREFNARYKMQIHMRIHTRVPQYSVKGVASILIRNFFNTEFV